MITNEIIFIAVNILLKKKMVLGAQGAQEDQTEGGSPGSPDGESPGIQKDVDSTTGNYGLRQCAPKNSFLPKTFPF